MSAKKHKPEENKTTIDEEKLQRQPEDQMPSDFEAKEKAVSPEEEINLLRSERDQALEKANEYLEGWQRERAEFFNYKKRMERDLSQGGQNAFGNAIRRYLDIADDLARALKNKNRPTEGNGAVWAEGIDLIQRKFICAFEADGVMMMDTKDQYFDPNLHEAISNEDSPDHESGQIIDVVQPGYTLGERVIRPARVRVAR
ncbi:MAG: nucleotide exchange factor GrpE [Chloroflexi bacterium RBG_13_50_21]|nr:MAG: nucleotide exchange factor GrpE [Chloroflexi bacterium RBG_13_50_21]OGO64643.1 MAG: nucleotide exchange factor GrpE [Chloroflexi bacterium RBG_19FT_COMBO_47_9]